MRILVVGGGAREHAIVWKLAQSPQVDRIYVAPGNAGTAQLAENLSLKANDIDGIVTKAKELDTDLVVVGPEDPLALGLVDSLEEAGLAAFGPRRAAAEIESSKVFAKELMVRRGIPTGRAAVFASLREAEAYLARQASPIVVKADGLAAGKGVFICSTLDEARRALAAVMEERRFGDAGERVLIEDCLSGPEVSVFAFTDGETVSSTVAACDYKRIFDDDQGPNTGGMGSYAPPDWFTAEMEQEVRHRILEPTVRALFEEGRPYRGVLYAGLMVTEDGPQVLEFNCRLGDPETQVILPRLESDLAEVCLAVTEGRLADVEVRWSDRACVGVVMASGGYPGSYATGFPIQGLGNVDREALVFHAGTALDDKGAVVTAGGRVLTVVGSGDSLAQARERAYQNVPRIAFQGAHYRKDIAAAVAVASS